MTLIIGAFIFWDAKLRKKDLFDDSAFEKIKNFVKKDSSDLTEDTAEDQVEANLPSPSQKNTDSLEEFGSLV